MEPGFYRGDILFLNMGKQPVRVGEVVVFNIDNRDIPIVHRVIKVHEALPGGDVSVLTKVSCCSTQSPQVQASSVWRRNVHAVKLLYLTGAVVNVSCASCKAAVSMEAMMLHSNVSQTLLLTSTSGVYVVIGR